MKNLMFPIIALLILALSACSLAPAKIPSLESNQPTESLDVVNYTDEDIESLIQQFPYLRIIDFNNPLPGDAPEDALEQLDINIEVLDLVGRRIGNCYNEFMYDVSPSYLLIIDRNACYELQVWVELKDSSR